MSSGNPLAEEIEALKSIYEKDITCDGSEIVITLFPLQEKEKKETFVQVDLSLDCSANYPEKEPVISLKNIKGLSDKLLEILYWKLNEMAKALRGEVMIYNLAYFVQEFLSENNKPEKKSCYEEMLIRKEQQKQEEYQSEVYKKTKLMRDIQEKQKEMFQFTENESSNDDSEDGTEKADELVVNSIKPKAHKVVQKEIICDHRSCKYMQFNNKILRGRCVEHDSNSVIYCAIDSTTGDQLLLQEWILKPIANDNQTFATIQQTLEKIQKDLNHLKKLCHENLISYIDFKWSLEKGEWIVHVLQEYATSVNLNVLIEKKTELDINFIQYILTGVLNGLEYLHSHGVVHGCLTGSNIHINNTGVVKLSGYGIKTVIDDLHNSCKSISLEPSGKNVSTKSDILKVGLLLLKVIKFVTVGEKNIVVPDFQPPELKEFVEKCLIENEEVRWTARKLLNHKFLKVKDCEQNGKRKKFSGSEASLKINAEIEKPYEVIYNRNEDTNSRLSKEFKILNYVGNGSFGKVLKVKNKLDGNIYAIKAIRLNTKNKQMDKKMIREVKLLSKLNHENVVRYYTSWIETDSISPNDASAGTALDIVDGTLSNRIKGKNNVVSTNTYADENEDEEDDEEEEEDDDEEDDEDEDEGGGESESSDELDSPNVKLDNKTDQSSYIQFLGESGDKSKEINSFSSGSTKKDSTYVEPNRTMYIQMEFCEKSTLRIAINDTSFVKLCEDESRLWRLFREIVEGLAYVHGQGMIHRDLKPENIFLDSSDHVKIGDFGLATISVVSKCFWFQTEATLGAGDNNVSSQNMYDDYLTGRVGTSLYVAPELDKIFGKSFYNKKVDIYSLGIIFFEMCNGSFSTDMERIETILNLRKTEIILPAHWQEKLPKQRNLVKKLLNHDPKSRPSCQEMLEGNYLPPAEFEYEHLQEIMRQTLTNPKSKAYKYLILSCFDQEVRIEEDVTYQFENVRSEKQYFLLDMAKERMENLLKKHGAIYFSAPLLLPKTQECKNTETKVNLMTHSGSIVNLPHDLRISFARFAAVKALTRLRRYVVERVYREKKVHGLHPKEQYECAFDLVTPSHCIQNAELEVLSLTEEVINIFKSLKSRNCVIRLNHYLLLKAVLIHFNSEKWYSDVFRILSSAKENKYFKSKLATNLQALGIQSVSGLINLFLKEDTLSNVKKELLSLTNKRGKTLDILNTAFQKLHAVIAGAERLDISIPIKIALGVVCNSEHCSDIMFDVAYHIKQRGKKEGCVTVMSGCRYDGLIASFRRLFELTTANSEYDQPSAVGLTVYLDKIVAILKEDNILSEYVVVFSIGNNQFLRTKESIVKKLWEAGIKCYLEQTIETLEELTEYCRENKIIHIVNLKDEDSGFVYVMTWDNDKNHYLEKKISIREVADFMLKSCSKQSEGCPTSLFSRQHSESLGKSSSGDMINVNQNVNIHFISDEKLSSTQRRRYDNQIRSQISSIACRFSTRTRLEIVGVLLDEQKVKELAINFKASESPSHDIESVPDRYAEKKHALKVYSKVRSLLANTSNTVVILYSLFQDKFSFIFGPD